MSQIRWRKGDYISLGKAVSQFNKKVRELQKEESKLYLPNEISYKEAKENILTRRELTNLINSLKRFNKEGSEKLYVTEAGEEMTLWERRELGIKSRVAQNKLQKELNLLNEPLESGYSRAQMGSQRVKEIKRNIERLKSFEEKTGTKFERLKYSINKYGGTDYSLRKAMTYRENYVNEMKKYSHLDNYDKLVALFNKLKNPKKFYEYMSRNELTKDLTYQSDQYYTQQAFNSFLQDLGIEINTDSIS